MRRNYLGPRGLRPLLLAVGHWNGLRYVNLASNFLNNSSVEALGDLLSSPGSWPSLAYIDLSFNPISNPSGRLLLRILDSRQTLAGVGVQGTLMNPAIVRRIDGVLRRRNASFGAQYGCKTPPLDGLRALAEVSRELNWSKTKDRGVSGEWSAMETLWNLAVGAAPPEDGWMGLASVMAVVRQDAAIASMF